MTPEQDIYKGHYLRVTEQEGNDGHVFERVHIRDGVSVIPIMPSGHLRFVREVSWHDGQEYTKPVTGYIEDDESLLDCAKRELEEELGLVAEEWQLSGGFGAATSSMLLRLIEEIESNDH